MGLNIYRGVYSKRPWSKYSMKKIVREDIFAQIGED